MLLITHAANKSSSWKEFQKHLWLCSDCNQFQLNLVLGADRPHCLASLQNEIW